MINRRLKRILSRFWHPLEPQKETDPKDDSGQVSHPETSGPPSLEERARELASLGAETLNKLSEFEQSVIQVGEIKDRTHRLQALLATADSLEDLPLSTDLNANLKTLQYIFDASSDLIVRRFRLPGGREGAALYFDGMVDRTHFDDLALEPLTYDAFPIRTGAPGTNEKESLVTDVGELLESRAIPVSQLKRVRSIKETVDAVTQGDAALLIDGEAAAFTMGLRGYEHRRIGEPATEAVIRGPREGFVESLRTNTTMLRRRLHTPQLKLEPLRLGRVGRTDVVIAYLKGIAGDDIVSEVRRRLAHIDIDAVIETSYIEELIEDDPYSPFPQILNSERPDTVAAHLLEGRVAIMLDGSPFALVVPITLWGLMQSTEDYYHRFYVGSFLRLIRYLFAVIALLAPAFYIAITTFHQEMLPTTLLLTIAALREGIPFPSVVEAFLMELTFEALREAGVRLPRPVGQAVSIVGALVIGQAAVQAGIVSSIMVIVVATTGIASFTFAQYNLGISVRILRFPIMIMASLLGLYGIILSLLVIIVHLCGLRSFGVPYMSPLAPLEPAGLGDTFLRLPLWLRPPRPQIVDRSVRKRQKRPVKPGPDPWEGPGG